MKGQERGRQLQWADSRHGFGSGRRTHCALRQSDWQTNPTKSQLAGGLGDRNEPGVFVKDHKGHRGNDTNYLLQSPREQFCRD